MLNIAKTQKLNDSQLIQLLEVSLALHADEIVQIHARDLHRVIQMARRNLTGTYTADECTACS